MALLINRDKIVEVGEISRLRGLLSKYKNGFIRYTGKEMETANVAEKPEAETVLNENGIEDTNAIIDSLNTITIRYGEIKLFHEPKKTEKLEKEAEKDLEWFFLT